VPSNHLLASILVGFSLVGCVKSIVINAAAGALSGGGGTYSSDDDPELVREAIPFGLKTIESLLGEAPGNPKLLLAAASGFTQYGYAFVQQDAERFDEKDPDRSRQLYARARRLYARARGYGMRGLDAHHEGFTAAFDKDRAAAVKVLSPEDVPLVYWTTAAWAAQISITKSDAMLLGDLPNVEALMGRALDLDEGFGDGAIHEFYISYDGGRSESVGGSVTRAKGHFARALALTGGKKLGPYVSWAESVAVQAQDRKQFRELLEKVLAFNADEAPQFRLVNLIAQDRARRLLARSDDLFAE
jgi:hypothetical protein